jgi:hypothetical protein
MKKIITISILVTAFFYSSCGSSENKNAEKIEQTTSNNIPAIEPDFTKYFEGTIDGKYGIIMTLTKNANNLTGTYTYKSQGTPIKISGTTDDSGNLTINEFNDKGNMTGIFKGQLTGNNIIGQWTKPDGSKTMPFRISESVNIETSISANQSQSDSKKAILSNLVGEYKLNSISCFYGANTMADYWIENGKWIANETSNHGGQREGYYVELTADVLQKLKSMKIVVAQDLSVSLTCNGKKYYTSQFKDNGMELLLSKSPNAYSSLPENLNNGSTIIENFLYILAKDNIDDNLMNSINITYVLANVLVIKYNITEKEFEVNMFNGVCCDNSSYTFK